MKVIIKTIILSLYSLLILSGCSSSSSDTQAYACDLPCISTTVTLSKSAISSATGGNVDVSFKILGELTDLSSVNVRLASIHSGLSAGSVPVFSPAQRTVTATITVNAGKEPGEYYPYVQLFVDPQANISSIYYLDPEVSATHYTYYEINQGITTKKMLSPYELPVFKVAK